MQNFQIMQRKLKGTTLTSTYPDSSVNHTYLVWSSGAGLYQANSTVSEKPNTSTHFDSFGRVTRKSVAQYDGSYLHTDIDYDGYGRPYRESLPFKGGAASLWNVTSFDPFDRPSGLAYASGKTGTFSYSGKNITSTENGISSTYYYDAQGNLTSVSDPA